MGFHIDMDQLEASLGINSRNSVREPVGDKGRSVAYVDLDDVWHEASEIVDTLKIPRWAASYYYTFWGVLLLGKRGVFCNAACGDAMWRAKVDSKASCSAFGYGEPEKDEPSHSPFDVVGSLVVQVVGQKEALLGHCWIVSPVDRMIIDLSAGSQVESSRLCGGDPWDACMTLPKYVCLDTQMATRHEKWFYRERTSFSAELIESFHRYSHHLMCQYARSSEGNGFDWRRFIEASSE